MRLPIQNLTSMQGQQHPHRHRYRHNDKKPESGLQQDQAAAKKKKKRSSKKKKKHRSSSDSGSQTPKGGSGRNREAVEIDTGHEDDIDMNIPQLEFRTVLRVRPLLRKEREDHVILESFSSSNAVALHPMPVSSSNSKGLTEGGSGSGPSSPTATSSSTTTANSIITTTTATAISIINGNRNNNSSNSSSISPMVSPRIENAVQKAHDVVYHFDRVLPPKANQERMYWSIGHPIAQSVMETLKTIATTRNNENGSDDAGANKNTRTTHLIVGMGLTKGGKTHTCWGGSVGNGGGGMGGGGVVGGTNGETTPKNLVVKRNKGLSAPSPDDGLIPKMLDSLFSQARHHVVSAASRQMSDNNKNATMASSKAIFAVKMTIVLVDQDMNTPSEEPKLYDLLQTPTRRPGSTQHNGNNNMKENYTKLLFSRSSAKKNSNSSGTAAQSPSSSSPLPSNDQNNAPIVSIEHDPSSSEYTLVNGHERSCFSIDEARECLTVAMQNRRKLLATRTILGMSSSSSSSSRQTHVLIQMHPVMMDRRKDIVVREGGRIALLDMASTEPIHIKSKAKKLLHHGTAGQHHHHHHRRSASKDAISGEASDGYTSVACCLHALRNNETTRRSLTTTVDDAVAANDDDFPLPNSSPTSVGHHHHHHQHREPTPKKVPFKRHVLTMLLQTMFSKRHTDKTTVTIILAVSPSHRDYLEKKFLLTDLESLRLPSPCSDSVSTGVEIQMEAGDGEYCAGVDPDDKNMKNVNMKSFSSPPRATSNQRRRSSVETTSSSLSPSTAKKKKKKEDRPVIPAILVGKKYQQHYNVIPSDGDRKLQYKHGNVESSILPVPPPMAKSFSMTYSDSTGDDDYGGVGGACRAAASDDVHSNLTDHDDDDDGDTVIPLPPPPVAPGYSEEPNTMRRGNRFSSHHRRGSVSSIASAPPMEEEEEEKRNDHENKEVKAAEVMKGTSRSPPPSVSQVDFPGVVPTCGKTGTKKNGGIPSSSSDLLPSTNCKPKTLVENTSSMVDRNTANVGSSSSPEAECRGESTMLRMQVKGLQERLAELKNENDKLKQRNDRLTNENEDLKKRLESSTNGTSEGQTSPNRLNRLGSLEYGSYDHDDEPVVMYEDRLGDKGREKEATSNTIFDNPLFKQIAHMSRV